MVGGTERENEINSLLGRRIMRQEPPVINEISLHLFSHVTGFFVYDDNELSGISLWIW